MNHALTDPINALTCKANPSPLSQAEILLMLQDLNDWQLEGNTIAKTFLFQNYYETMSFVNATAWLSHREDHHPDLQVGYNQCRVQYSTHSVGGLSEYDFICAAKTDKLF